MYYIVLYFKQKSHNCLYDVEISSLLHFFLSDCVFKYGFISSSKHEFLHAADNSLKRYMYFFLCFSCVLVAWFIRYDFFKKKSFVQYRMQKVWFFLRKRAEKKWSGKNPVGEKKLNCLSCGCANICTHPYYIKKVPVIQHAEEGD